jgi:hypothetical protein
MTQSQLAVAISKIQRMQALKEKTVIGPLTLR